MKLIKITAILLLLSINSITGKEKSDFLDNFDFKIIGAQYMVKGNSEKIDMHDVIRNQLVESKTNNEDYFILYNNLYSHATDQPLAHGAFYIDFKTNFSSSGFKVDADLIGECRGISYGTFNSSNMLVFPKIKLAFDSSFKILDQSFRAGVSVGNYDDIRLYEGLNFYNMDVEGSNFYFQWENVRLEFNRVGDLSQSIGLRIGDSNDWILSVFDIDITDGWKSDLKLGYFDYGIGNYNNSILDMHSGYTASLALHRNNTRFYTQAAIRGLSDDFHSVNQRSAFLAGIEQYYFTSNLKLYLKAEYRYYGYYFNHGYYDDKVRYKDDDRYGYANTVGEYLYPLYNYDKSFSQWAVFTDYQGRNVSGIILDIESTYYFYDKFVLKADLDLNYISASLSDSFIYPFYRIGIGYEPLDDSYIFLGLTNKTMNLDRSYPTFYLYDSPALNLTYMFNFDLNN